ncbi:unnamed protein product [Schistosoma rodhaini]|uniref:Spp2/MOS2 G-patch domain-containing protein n=1 Tax=Schistosoma rodhaini TaxID=6188 RepID=A0AA85G8N5_9TREM|nr:unnamed protein product [Schistosoma rodhaini]CAH8609805.1 unnamed protein product [Schistosoma rodhaini]
MSLEGNMSDLKPKLAFSFLQRRKQLIRNPKVTSLDTNNGENIIKGNKEFITSIEDKIICSTAKKDEELIIPLKRSKSSFHERMKKNFLPAESLDPLTLQALQEIKEESQAFSSSSHNFHVNYDLKIPANSSETAEETENANYDAIPIEKFGVALLAGMGFDPKSLDSSKKEVVLPQRPKGLGLGANPTAVQDAKQELLKSKVEKLTWNPGARCQILLGKNKGLYGTLEGLDGDTGRVIIKLKVSKEVVTVLQHTVRLVPIKEFAAYSNCINQNQVDEYKAREAEQLSLKSNHNSDSDPLRSKSTRSEQSTHSDSIRKTSKISGEDKPLKCEPNRPSGSISWLRPKLIVRCLDKNYCGGKYNKEKLIIISIDGNQCSCKTESGQIIEGSF